MLSKTKIGVCIDYEIAYLLEEKNDENLITIIEAKPLNESNAHGISKKTKNQNFYKNIVDVVKNFEEVVLFGPDYLKNQIIVRIKANNTLHIEIQSNAAEDDITESKKIQFINDYFRA